MDINLLKIFGGALLMFSFIYFILIRAINTKNYKRKSLYIFISGMILVLFFVGGLVYDIIKQEFNNFKNNIGYYSFLIVSIAFVSFFTIFYYIKGNNARQKFSSSFSKKKHVPTIKDKKEFVYIILKYNNGFVLEKKNELYSGIILKFTNTDFFHDEIIKDYIIKNNLNILSYKYIGKAKKVEKKDNIFYCYKLLLNEMPDNNQLEFIDGMKLLEVPMSEENKKIIYNSVISDNIDIIL